jgi:hypothetical protein
VASGARWTLSASRAGIVPLLALAVAGGLLLAVNLYLTTRSIALISDGALAVDWVQYVESANRLGHPNLYAITDSYAYRYSPLLAALFGLLAPLGVIGWRLLHVAAALALPSWPMRLVVLLSWPFWYDVQSGNFLTFIVLAAAWAIRGSRVGTAAFLLLTLLVPRPLMLPVAAWLLWQRPAWRAPFAIAALAQVALVFVTGMADDWLRTLINAGSDALLPSNVGPSRFIGNAWILIGLPFAAWLTKIGRLGLASLAASPYWLPYYLLMAALELAPSKRLAPPEAPLSR